MTDSDGSTQWEVVTATAYDRGNPAAGAEETTVARGGEHEARRVYADTTAEAGERGYEYVRLRCEGRDVESWPQQTGWTV
ncbi:hypothetical protein [Mycolicibacterium parafortuitum]|uniref:Uncharacterized protein n=1 Tax=Mycolicibacterium parafortuitum TaxID=39692 RepID=A0A375YE22_MYCPF|nr:hypothetical protein [Mycolicibacterium parafortuitum]ORB29296.1 hypothetical protein BST38_16435 [Mycolicibacterium parafortuitum]SRX79308.1 hypothetical protein MPP7335_01045 [Mycolicibacterium parafortuitum]